jgi:hypothetical protein
LKLRREGELLREIARYDDMIRYVSNTLLFLFFSRARSKSDPSSVCTDHSQHPAVLQAAVPWVKRPELRAVLPSIEALFANRLKLGMIVKSFFLSFFLSFLHSFFHPFFLSFFLFHSFSFFFSFFILIVFFFFFFFFCKISLFFQFIQLRFVRSFSDA